MLGRLLSPLEGVGAEELPIDALKERVRGGNVTEVLVATPPSVDGEATALLVARGAGSPGRRGQPDRERGASMGATSNSPTK